jgi:hypothetical protein
MHFRQVALFLLGSVWLPPFGDACLADEINYSMDELTHHPYHYLPAFGHAAQMPGSPKYFVPAYGYRIPGFGFRGGYRETLNSYTDYYRFGQRVNQHYTDTKQRYWRNSYGGPWYYPGYPFNTQTAWPDW